MTNIWTHTKHALYGLAAALTVTVFDWTENTASALPDWFNNPDVKLLIAACIGIALPYVQRAEEETEAWLDAHDGGDTPTG